MKRRLLAAPLLIPALLTACGTQQAGASGPADPSRLAARASALGVAPELVYVTDAPGYTVAQQSVGVHGDDGFSAAYVSTGAGTHIQLTVDRGTFPPGTCPRQAGADAPAPCTRDGDAWYRAVADHQEYALPKGDHVIRISADGVPRDVLRTAVVNVHRPTADELDAHLPSTPAREPVERGDLPPEGDGAPDNDVDVGG